MIAEVVKYLVAIAVVLILFVVFGLYARGCDRL